MSIEEMEEVVRVMAAGVKTILKAVKSHQQESKHLIKKSTQIAK